MPVIISVSPADPAVAVSGLIPPTAAAAAEIFQDRLQLVPSELIGPLDRNQNQTNFHPMVRTDWQISDHIRGVLGLSFVELPLAQGGSVLANTSHSLMGLTGTRTAWGRVADQFVGNNDGTNIVFDYSLNPTQDAMTLTFSEAGWKSYDVTEVAADWFSHADVDGDQDHEVMATETALIIARLNSYVGTSPTGPATAPGLLWGAADKGPFFDHTTLLYLPSPNAAIRRRTGTSFNVEPIYSYERRSWSLEQTIAPDAVPEHILPNAYYLQFELENTTTTLLAGERYKYALSLGEQAIPNANGEDGSWFRELDTDGYALTERLQARFYEIYAQALAAATNQGTLPWKAETINRDLMVLYRDRDTLTEDVINPEAIPFYNKITIPGDNSGIFFLLAKDPDPVAQDFIDLLQYRAIQGLVAPPITSDFRVATKTINPASGDTPHYIYSVGSGSYDNLQQVSSLITDPTSQESTTLANAVNIQQDRPVPGSSVASLHRRGLNNTPSNPIIDDDIYIPADNFAKQLWSYHRQFHQILANQPCHTETLMYVIKKYRGDSATPAQTFYFTNRFDGQDIIFYDSQIKPKQRYRYTFERVILIIGNEYSYSFPNVNPAEIDFIRNSTGYGSYNAQLNITNQENLKTCLVPYIAGDVITIVEDNPPVPPDISFHPFHGVNNQIKILLNAQIGITSEKPVAILEEDKNFFADEYLSQTGLTATYEEIETIEFRSDDPVDAYTLFRLTTKPSSYRDFESGARLSLNPERGIPGAIIDRIRPNTIYYYCARAVDINGNVSNPTHIFEIELIDNAGQIFLRREIIQFESTQVEYTKTGQRYIYIEPSMLQLAMLDATENHIGTPSTISPPNDTILGASGVEPVWQKTFKIRTTSKKTGRKLDLNLTFKNTGIVNPSE